MKLKILSGILVLMFAQTIFAASPGWDKVQKQKKGRTLHVLLKSGRWLVADVEKVEPEKLLVENGAGRYEVFWKNEIREIRIQKGSVAKSTFIGTAIAAGSVFITGIMIESGYFGEDKYMLTTMATLTAAPIGATLGFLHGRVTSGKDLIYKSEMYFEENPSIQPLTIDVQPKWLEQSHTECLFCGVSLTKTYDLQN